MIRVRAASRLGLAVRHDPPRGSCQKADYGAIAQLGERLHGMQEVGGSIPPGSTTLRPSGYAWRSRAMAEGRSVPGEAHLGEDGLELPLHFIYLCHLWAKRGAVARWPMRSARSSPIVRGRGVGQ